MDYSKHLFRASSFGNLMTGAQGLTDAQHKEVTDLEALKTAKKPLTTKQQEDFDSLSVKEELSTAENSKLEKLTSKSNEIIGLTETKKKKLDKLVFQRDNTILSKGAKTYLRKLRREIKFERRVQLKSKFLTKGIEMEEEAIDFLSVWHDTEFTNNKLRVENGFFTGEVDVLEGYDTKASWSLDTLPDPLEKLDSLYEFQNRVYMALHNAEKWTTSYVLINATDSELTNMIYREGFKWDGNNIPDWKKLEILNLYIYDMATFMLWCNSEDCLPDIDLYKEQLETDNVDPALEKAVNIFTSFVEIPDYERIVEKTTYRDLELESIMNDVVILSREYMKEVEGTMLKQKPE